MNSNVFIGFDFETGGLSVQSRHGIVQISLGAYELCRNKDNKLYFKEIDYFNAYFKPYDDWNYDPEATKIHGKDQDFLLKNGRERTEIWHDIISFFEKHLGSNPFFWSYYMVAHNASFDIGFLSFLENECNTNSKRYFKVCNKVTCTMQLFNLMRVLNLHTIQTSKLDDLIKHFKINDVRSEKHDAIEDVRLHMSLFAEILNIMPNDNLIKQKSMVWIPEDSEWNLYQSINGV